MVIDYELDYRVTAEMVAKSVCAVVVGLVCVPSGPISQELLVGIS